MPFPCQGSCPRTLLIRSRTRAYRIAPETRLVEADVARLRMSCSIAKMQTCLSATETRLVHDDDNAHRLLYVRIYHFHKCMDSSKTVLRFEVEGEGRSG